MSAIDLASMDARALLRLFGDIGEELVRRQISRSASNPTADYAQRLIQDALDLTWSPHFSKGYNATDVAGQKYKIRSRRITSTSSLNVIKESKDLNADEFDWLVVVLFSQTFDVSRALILPKKVVQAIAKRTEKGYELELPETTRALHAARDITIDVQRTQNAITL